MCKPLSSFVFKKSKCAAFNLADIAMHGEVEFRVVVVECQDERSQYKNKDKALKILRSRLLDAAQREHDAAIASDRKSQVGTGDRSERIRTYNYPQGRVTDHRIGLTLYKLEQILNGDIDEIIDALTTYYRTEALRAENGE